MPKTNLVDGSIVTPEYLNNINGVDANTGHTHNGTDDDGSVPKIVLTSAAHVTGELPIDNMGATEINATLEISVDAGSTYPITNQFDISRIGNIINIHLLDNFTQVMSVGSAIFIRPQGGGSWNGNIFPLSSLSLFSGYFEMSDSLTASTQSAFMEYTGINNPIEIRPQGGGIFASGGTVSWGFGTFGQLIRRLS